MKQKITIRVPSNGRKSCSKAMRIVFSLPRVEYSAALKGDDKAQIEITGDNVDPVELTTKLRRKMGQVDLVSVSEIKKEEKNSILKNSIQTIKMNKTPKVEKPKDGPREPPYFWAYGQGPYGCNVDPEPTTQYQDNSWSMYGPIRQSWMQVMDRPIRLGSGSPANPLAGGSRRVTERVGLIHPNAHPYVRANTHLRFK